MAVRRMNFSARTPPHPQSRPHRRRSGRSLNVSAKYIAGAVPYGSLDDSYWT
jgi:hypothetical protein